MEPWLESCDCFIWKTIFDILNSCRTLVGTLHTFLKWRQNFKIYLNAT